MFRVADHLANKGVNVKTATSTESVRARIIERLVKHVGQHRYQMWFDHSARLQFQSHPPCLQVAVPNQFIADWIARHFDRALREAVDPEKAALQVCVDPDRFAVTPAAEQQQPAPPRQRRVPARNGPILRHQLESFVVGPSNELAYATSVRLAEQDQSDTRTTLLFLHGGCGLGKTHLLQGICHRSMQQLRGAKVLYTTAEQFTNGFLTAVRTNQIDSFRQRIRELDLLCVDDVHFLANKQATQREFLHSFDVIQLAGARVALASDNHPKHIRQFSEHLVSRCMRGMVVQIHPPDPKTRIGIIRELARQRGLSLMDSVIDALAAHTLGSVREIEGTLTKLHALANLAQQRKQGPACDGRIGHTLLQQLLESQIPQPRKVVRFDTIVMKVCDHLKVNPAQVRGRDRRHLAVLGRGLVVYLARRLTSMSFPEIATALGRTHHSTVTCAARRIEKQMRQQVDVTLPGTLKPLPLPQVIAHLHQVLASG